MHAFTSTCAHTNTHTCTHVHAHAHAQSPSGSRWVWPAGYRTGAPGRLSLSPSGQRWLVGLCASPQPRTPHPALCQAAPAASPGPRQRCRSHPDPLNRGPDAHCSEPLLAAWVWASAPGAIRDPRAGPLCLGPAGKRRARRALRGEVSRHRKGSRQRRRPRRPGLGHHGSGRARALAPPQTEPAQTDAAGAASPSLHVLVPTPAPGNTGVPASGGGVTGEGLRPHDL